MACHLLLFYTSKTELRPQNCLWQCCGKHLVFKVRSTQLILLRLTRTWRTHAWHKKGNAKMTGWSLTRNKIIAIAMLTHGQPLTNTHHFTCYKQGHNLILSLGGSWKGKGWKQTDSDWRKKTLACCRWVWDLPCLSLPATKANYVCKPECPAVLASCLPT